MRIFNTTLTSHPRGRIQRYEERLVHPHNAQVARAQGAALWNRIEPCQSGDDVSRKSEARAFSLSLSRRTHRHVAPIRDTCGSENFVSWCWVGRVKFLNCNYVRANASMKEIISLNLKWFTVLNVHGKCEAVNATIAQPRRLMGIFKNKLLI